MTNLYLQYGSWLREKRVTEGTVYRRTNFLRRMVTEVGHPADVTGEQLVGWLANYDGWTATSYYAGMRSMISFAMETGLRVDDPMRRMRPPKAPEPMPKPLTGEDLERVLGAAVGRLRDWLLLALLQGLRSHEIAKVRGEEISKGHFYVCGKGGQVALLPTHPLVWEMAQNYPREGWWFPSHGRTGHVTSNWITQSTSLLFDDLDLSGSIHRVRATYGTTLLKNGENIRVVQKLLRHARLTSTEHYLGVDQDELTKAIRNLLAA